MCRSSPAAIADDQDDATLRAHAEEVGYPLLLKASAGGGGKGMRVVTEASGLDAAIAGAKREAASAFGDDTLLVERYVDRPRHVEIQILGDQHGNLVHLFERECSIQRRHQKIIEETPSTALDDDLRQRMGAAAVKVGAAVGYTNAGTVEFILAPDGEFYFLEVNTRLQVEHPVTEMVTGLDLVREQIRVARGEVLGLDQDDIVQRGAALECRLYAEDPDNGFLPTTGRLADWHLPDLPGLRVDTGVEAGAEISIHYDPMIAKVLCHAPTRSEAIRAMIYSLEQLAAPGVVTNRDYLVRVLRHPAFAAGELDTHFVATHADALRPVVREGAVERAAAVATAFDHELGRRARTLLPGVEPGFRLEGFGDEHVTYAAGDQQVTVRYRNAGGGRLQVDAGELSLALQVVSIDGPAITAEEDGRRRRYRVVTRGERRWVMGDGAEVALEIEPRFPVPGTTGPEGACIAPMPGKVVKLLVSASQPVEAGTPLVILEAMKMEHTISAPEEGVVTEIAVAEGDQVEADAVLVVVAPRE